MLKKSDVVLKSNRLVEASYRLSLNEQRIILYAICQCREDDLAFSPDMPVTITADAFAKQFPQADKTNVYRQLRDAMDALYDRSVTINDVDPVTGHDRVTKTRWISTASYIDGAGHVQIIFAPKVIPYIARVEQEFTSYQLERVGHMTSFHAIRIYELLSQYRDIRTRQLSLVELRTYLQIEPQEYKLTANFIRKVINVAVEQINEHSDLVVKCDSKKTGRAITDFIFKIKSKTAQPKSSAPTDADFRTKLEANGQQRIPDLPTNDQEEF
jgi:plasmid replication initiation protein